MRFEEDGELWRSRARVVLSPIAAPSILGLFGFCGATFIVAANLAGWYGSKTTGDYLFPMAAIFGGVAQFLAAMWSYKARDGLATAMHGMWGSFWMAYGILWAMFATKALAPPPGEYFPALGFWFIMLAAITWMGAFASFGENLGLAATLVSLAAGSSLLAAAYMSGTMWLQHFGG
ncbi:MAG TPA: GPR1/FUN34/YaaH family transporter, partial [Mycobacterium sp.]|nr:GPR1/FUN34/YaaH family transporter [Mycobacterium sp.]